MKMNVEFSNNLFDISASFIDYRSDFYILRIEKYKDSIWDFQPCSNPIPLNAAKIASDSLRFLPHFSTMHF